MKNIFRTMLPILAMAACVWASCSDDKDDPTPGKPALPTIAVSEPALSADNAKAVVTVTPSEETEKWYWKCEPKGQSAAAYTAVTGKDETRLEIPVDMDVTYTLTVYAENETGKSKEVSKEFAFKSEDVMTELVEFEVKNLSAFSVDVVVKKSAKCTKYVIGAINKGYMGQDLEGGGGDKYVEIYKEETFIEDAEISLNPNADYPMQPYNWSDVSATFTEKTLVRAALKDKDISESKGIILRSLEADEIQVIIAVYALDAEGKAKVYTKEITVPEPELTGQVAVTIDVPKDKIKLKSFEATFTADESCSRIHVGQSSAGLIASNSSKTFDNMTEDEICASIVRLGAEVPLAYTGPFSKEFANKDMKPDTEFIVYAIPIDKEGKIGKVVYQKVKTAAPVFDGVGEITNVSFPDQQTSERLPVDITVNDEVEFVRILWDMGKGPGSLDLNWVMSDEDSRDVNWHEYAVADLASLKTDEGGLRITSPGYDYYLRAVTVDKNGKLSEVIDLVEKAGKGTNGIKTKEEEVIQSTTDWTGNGALTLSVEGTGMTDAGMYTADLKVTKSNNTKRVYMVKWAGEAQPGGIDDFVKTLSFFDTFDPEATPTLGAVTVVLDASDSEKTTTEEFMDEYSASWGGDARIYVTLDNDGKLSIADWYIHGYGTKNDHN